MPRSPAPTLYVTDLDGTLLRRDASLSASAREALCTVLARGTALTVATARSLPSMRRILGDLPLRLPVIAHNGAVVGPLEGPPLQVTALPDASARAAYERLAAHHPMVTAIDGAREQLVVGEVVNDGARAYLAERQHTADPRLTFGDPAAALAHRVIGLTVIAERAVVEGLDERLAEVPGLRRYLFDDLYSPGWAWLTVQPAAASKATVIEAVRQAASLGDRRLVVFGDQVNDLPMFAAADHAVATGNAHPTARAAADEVIGSSDDDAVPAWLLEATA